MKAPHDDLRRILRASPRNAADLCQLLQGINRSTLMRLVRQLGDEVVRHGGSKRARYGLRRPLRGRSEPLPLYRIDEAGAAHSVGRLDLVYREGSVLALEQDASLSWPLDQSSEMRDGWFDGLPYPLLDMRPQGFLGRNFAHAFARSLDVAEDLTRWSDDDVLYVLSTMGHDQSGDLILGDRAYQRYLDERRDWDARMIAGEQIAQIYPEQASLALAQGVAGSSAGGEFPKFSALRELNGIPTHMIVKFSGDDDSVAVRRWADLLVCEHLAQDTLQAELGIAVAQTSIHRHAGRTFLEVVRFDRRGALGRLPMCSLSSLDAALLGKAGESWPTLAQAFCKHGWLAQQSVAEVSLIWWFGKLIANADMHAGNLSFLPGLTLAPVYDMLPMQYAPLRGGEVPPQKFAPRHPLPTEAVVWRRAAQAAMIFWQRAATDSRISTAFQSICADNAALLAREAERV